MVSGTQHTDRNLEILGFLEVVAWASQIAQAPAAELRRHARASMADLPDHLVPPALSRAANGAEKSAERDLHRLFKSLRMVLPVRVNVFKSQLIEIEQIRVSSWFRYLLQQQPDCLLGGFGLADPHSRTCLRAYWTAAQKDMGDHAVYELHGHELHRCIPFALHQDEGRGLRKTAVLVSSMQPLLGKDTATHFYAKLNAQWDDHMRDPLILDIMLEAQRHNGKGSTWRTRFLHTLLPKRMYTKHKSHIFEALLEELRMDCTNLIENGITLGNGDTYYPVCVAFKGDAPMIAKAANLTRSFQNLGNPCCPECLAGPTLPFEDVRRNPCWEASVHTTRPWDRVSPIVQIPGTPSAPEKLLKKDPFHIYKQSVGGSFVASALVLLLDLGYFVTAGPINNFDALLDRAYNDFAYFVKHELPGSMVPFIKHFTRTNLHFPRAASYPYARLKGYDTMLLTRWLLAPC